MFLQDLDLDRIRERHRAFWQREIVDRVCIAVTAPTDGPAKALPQARDDEQLLAAPQFAVDWALANLENTYFAGDALATACAPGNLLYPALGGEGSFGSGTVWVEPTVHAWPEWDAYRVDPNNVWAQRFLAVNRALAEAAGGRYLVSTQGFFGATDAMASIRGYQDFIVELLDEEAAPTIRAAQQRAIVGHEAIIRRAWRDVAAFQQGTVTVPMIWAPGTVNFWSADFSCLIGPASFETWLVPDFEAMIQLCDFSFYHLDGPDAVRHLPRVAALPGLHGIQYTPGPQSTLALTIDVTRRIQQFGKATFLWCDIRDVETILRELDPRGLFLCTHAPDRETADDLVRKAAQWSCRKTVSGRQWEG